MPQQLLAAATSAAHQHMAHVPHTVVIAFLSRTQHTRDIAITQLLGSFEMKQGAHHLRVACFSGCQQLLHYIST
jgi:hypothetical protein